MGTDTARADPRAAHKPKGKAMAGDDAHIYAPAEGHRLPHDPFKSIVGPRPIGWVSTVDAAGRPNLAPYSFFNALGDDPPIVGFSSTGWKHTVANAEATGAFCWNLSTYALREPMNVSSANVGAGVDEFALAGLTAAPGRVVAAPRVAESPVNFECRVTEIVRLRDAAGRSLEQWLVLGEVVTVHIAPDHLRDGLFDTAAAEPILRAGGLADYARINAAAMFRMKRPG